MTSNEEAQARSTTSSSGSRRREKPTSSVSSVSGVGANTPRPVDARKVQPSPGRPSTDTLGLANTPYSVWTSTRAETEALMLSLKRMSSWAKTPGAENVKSTSGTVSLR